MHSNHTYKTTSHYQTKAEAQSMDNKIAECLMLCGIPMQAFKSDFLLVSDIVDHIEKQTQ
jgi:hypothetical protein